jgi:hypothetical protein
VNPENSCQPRGFRIRDSGEAPVPQRLLTARLLDLSTFPKEQTGNVDENKEQDQKVVRAV